MPPAMLSTWPVRSGVLAHEVNRHGVADLDARQLGFLEIAVDVQSVAVDERHHALAGGHIGAGAEIHVGDVPGTEALTSERSG